MTNLFNYIDRPSPIHDLTGATKLVCLLLWSFAAMATYDTRLLAALALASFVLFRISRIGLRDVKFMLGFTAVFMVINNVLVYLFSPQHGTSIYGTVHVVLGSGRYALTQEQLFYHLNYFLKYLATIPIVLLFVCTTNPSEFAASLNTLGVKYSVAYSVALALRYIPDLRQEYREISQAHMEKIEVVSNAMELRCFGKYKKRTWYMGRPFRTADILSMVCCALLVALSFWLNWKNGSRFYNPFI